MASEFEVTITVKTNVPSDVPITGWEAMQEAMSFGLGDLVQVGEYLMMDIQVRRVPIVDGDDGDQEQDRQQDDDADQEEDEDEDEQEEDEDGDQEQNRGDEEDGSDGDDGDIDQDGGEEDHQDGEQDEDRQQEDRQQEDGIGGADIPDQDHSSDNGRLTIAKRSPQRIN